ncbi:MAG: TylF/MycF family methyltransferase [Betaproteobacteria bacterium]|nr:TylF/MycF family methyltransferase [Betaproteobacteria bacterium]
MNAELDAVFERNYALAEPHTLLMKAQVRSVYDRLLETRHLPGDCIEFGGFRGGLSFFLGLCIGDLGLAKRVIMLDSFQGLPQTEAALDGPFERGMMASDLQSVQGARAALGLDDVVEIRAGWFEDTLRQMPPAAQFCLAHLDADIYASTKTALRYLLPRLVPGGAVVLDDCLFFGANGVLRAAREEIGQELHLHLGPKTQAFVFPKGDPRSDRRAPLWRTLGGQRYDVAELLTRSDYLELATWEEAYYREHARWYADYLRLLSGSPNLPPDSHRVASAIGMVRKR